MLKPGPFISKTDTSLFWGLGLSAVPSTEEQKKICIHWEPELVQKSTSGLRNALRAVHTKVESIPFKLLGVESLVASLKSKAWGQKQFLVLQ